MRSGPWEVPIGTKYIKNWWIKVLSKEREIVSQQYHVVSFWGKDPDIYLGDKTSHFSLYTVFSSVQFCRSVVSNSLRPHGLQHTRLPCPSPTPRACSNSCPLSHWCHPTILSSVTVTSSWLSRVFSNTTVQKHQSFGTQFCLESNSHIHTWLLAKLWLDGPLFSK